MSASGAISAPEVKAALERHYEDIGRCLGHTGSWLLRVRTNRRGEVARITSDPEDAAAAECLRAAGRGWRFRRGPSEFLLKLRVFARP